MKTAGQFLLFIVASALVSCNQNESGKSPVIKRDGAEINYRVSGDGGATLLFVHGSYMDQTCWDEQVKYFSPDYKVVTFDLPGHGKSGKDRPYWTVEGFSDDVYAVIKKLHLKNVILIGHSLGADINLIAATSHPKNIIGFIGIDNFKNAATPLPAQYQKQTETILENLKKDFANTNEQYARMALLTPETSPEITNKIVSAYRNAYPPMGKQTMPEVFKMYETEERLLPQLNHKLHLINVDYIPTNEAPLKKYAGSGYEVLHMKGTSHYPMLENPQKLNQLLQQAIDDIARENDAAR
ncbi:MAG TPA: alpha/beta hydrolase [Flavobacterium sp.]|nr:alpha/beta hydrolase [Flavobacterium sp.]